jgi:1,4-alpha-glucan branching enzyme
MSLRKQFLKSKPVCKVTFSLDKSEIEEANEVKVLGTFNNWNVEGGLEMKKFKNGNFKASIDLPINTEYEFKYLVDGNRWINDAEADSYKNNGITADDNSVVIV